MKPVALIVDDSELQRWLLRGALEQLDFEVHEAASVESALLMDVVPAIACVDWSLEDGSGAEVCRVLRKRHGRDCTIVIVTAGAPHEMAAEILSSDAAPPNCDGLIEKSADVMKVALQIRSLFKARAGG